LPARISQEKESAIISLYLQGVNEADTAEKEHVSQSTVSAVISRYAGAVLIPPGTLAVCEP
jgi:DNA-directed RNA polymerase specialized sigma24 family protein